jgi:rSAM/selenodomain-associated transferase 2
VRERATLSIIVPVLNEAGAIEDALRSLAPLRARGAEVIVVDGGSTDATVTLARGLADRVLRAGQGRAHQMNAGAAAAGADLLLFLHADTRLPGTALDLILDGMQRSQRAWGRFDVRIDVRIGGASRLLKAVAACMNLRSRLTGIATGDQAIFVRRAQFLAVGGYPLQPLMEDIELSHRLKRRSRPLCLRACVTTSGRRWERFGVWRTIVLMWRLRLLYWLGAPADKLAKAYR